MVVKHCAGAVIYAPEDPNKVFLMTSPKWKGWIVPGGELNPGETSLQALVREIREELGIEITDTVYRGTTRKPASTDFYRETTEFVFENFFARALSKDIRPNHEIREWDWFPLDEARKLPMPDGIQNLLISYQQHLAATSGRPWQTS